MNKKHSFVDFQSDDSSQQNSKQNKGYPKSQEVDEDNEDEDSQENICVYPFTKKDASQLFHKKGDYKTYTEDQVYDQIKECLMDLDEYGFDFRCISWQFEPGENGNRFFKKFNRKVYIKFQCPNCVEQNQRSKAWTSILGNLQIRFQIQGLKKFWKQNKQYQEEDTDLSKMRYPSILKWMLKLYVEYCEKCGSAGEPLLYESQLKACQIEFCIVVTNILNHFQPNDNKGNRKKLMQVHHHKEQLCEACQKGECYNIPKSASEQIREKEV